MRTILAELKSSFGVDVTPASELRGQELATWVAQAQDTLDIRLRSDWEAVGATLNLQRCPRCGAAIYKPEIPLHRCRQQNDA